LRKVKAKTAEVTMERASVGQERVERETVLEATPAEVWEALTDPERLTEWMADEAEVELAEGGELHFLCDGEERAGEVETFEEERSLGFIWTRPELGRSRVEFTIEAVPAGTRLVVIESGLPSGPSATSAAAADWWVAKLGALRATLALVPA
jgi:uncharacterized protein YndB with AHSA1/START domain